MTIHVERIYDLKDNPSDGGRRVLVDRLWPRGIKKEALRLDAWLKDVAPDTELRHWFHADRDQWDEFRRRYFAYLDANPASWQPLLDMAAAGDVTLLYSAAEREHNNAVALADYLRGKMK